MSSNMHPAAQPGPGVTQASPSAPAALPRVWTGQRLRAWASYLAARLGVVGQVGAALAVLAVLLQVAVSLWMTPTLRAQAEEIAALRTELRQAPRNVQTVVARGPEALLASLPTLEDAPRFAESVQAEASRAGVLIERTDYRTPETSDPALSRLQMVVPARGDYAQLKRWLTRLLAAHPACALDELSLQRNPGGAGSAANGSAEPGGALTARVVLSYTMRSAR
jgi:hypothetical protein